MIVYDKEQKQIVIPNGLGNVNIIINGGGDCPECPGCNLGIGEYNFSADDEGTYELYASDDGYDGWSKMFINIDGGAIKVWRASAINNGEYPGYGTNLYIGGIITEIQEVIQDCYKTYVLDNRLKIYKGGWFDNSCFNDYDKPIKVGDYVIVYGVLQDNNGELIIEEGSQVIAYQECSGGEGGSCNLEDKWVTPSMNDRDGNNLIVVSPSEGYDGLSRTVIDPQTIYNEGVEAGRAEGGEGGCTLISRTFTSNGVYHPEAEQMQTIWFTNDKPSAYDTGVKLVNDSWVEIYFSATEGGDTPTLIGCEDSDWNSTTFATRWFDNNLGVKIGLNEIGIPYTAGDGKLHKLKFGKTVGVWFDDVKISDIAGEEWAPTDHTIYIGAMNDPSYNNENGFWRYWVGFIGDVTVYGNLNGNVAEYHFKAGDYGKWGEFKRVEDNTNLPNLGGDGMAIAQTGSYGEAPDGYNEITVNVPINSFEGTNHNDDIFHREAYWDGVEGYSSINIDNKPYGENKKNEGKQIIQNNLKDLDVTITSFGDNVFEAKMEDVAIPCLQINGQRFLTDYQPRIDSAYVDQNGFEIIIKAKLVSGEDNGGILIGTSASNDFEGYAHSNLILRTNMDATRLYLGKGWTPNESTRLNEWVTYRITVDGLYISSESNPVEQHIGWEVEPDINQNSWSSKVAIGGLNTHYDGTSSELRYSGRIAKVEFKQAETFTYVPAESGLFLRSETSTELQTIDGEAATYTTYTEKVGEYGWKKVTVRKSDDGISNKLNLWYNYTRIIDENAQINSDWDQALQSETIQNVFPGIAFTISGQAVAKPFFINAVNGNSTSTKIGKLVSSIYGTPVSCSVFSIGAFNCENIQTVDSEAFKYMTDLFTIDGMNNLGKNFTSSQTIDFTYCSKLFNYSPANRYMYNFAESLFDLSAGNKNGINSSTLKFNSAAFKDSNADAIALMRSKGWTVEFV